MLDNDIIEEVIAYSISSQRKRKVIVDRIRHRRMDGIRFNSQDNKEYMTVYTSVMMSISTDYPFLSKEVKNQIEKKIRFQAERSTGN